MMQKVALSTLFTLALAVGTATAQTSDELLATAAAEPGAERMESGLIYRSLREGTGPAPAAIDVVRVHYRGTLADGTEFDSSYKRGQPSSFPLTRVIKCWTEGVQKMKVGGKATLTCPASIAYGAKGAGDLIQPGAALRFEVELLAIINP